MFLEFFQLFWKILSNFSEKNPSNGNPGRHLVSSDWIGKCIDEGKLLEERQFVPLTFSFVIFILSLWFFIRHNFYDFRYIVFWYNLKGIISKYYLNSPIYQFKKELSDTDSWSSQDSDFGLLYNTNEFALMSSLISSGETHNNGQLSDLFNFHHEMDNQ